MTVLVDFVVKVLGLVFSTALDRHDKKTEENKVDNNIQNFEEVTAKGDVAAVADSLDAQHDRVRQEICNAGLQGDITSSTGTTATMLPGQRVASESTKPEEQIIDLVDEVKELPKVVTAHLINTLKVDEGFSYKPYWDNDQYTYGYGCKAPNADARITEEEACKLLKTRAQQSVNEFFVVFKGHEHKFNEVRQEVFVNMLFNLGMPKLLKFRNTLACITKADDVAWSSVAKHLEDSLWYKQVGKRAVRLVKEIKYGVYA